MNLASSSRLSAAAALPTDRPIRNARVPQAIGQSFDWLVPAEAEVLGARVADRPAAFPLAELEHYVRNGMVEERCPFRRSCYLIQRGTPVSYRYSFEDLLAVLKKYSIATNVSGSRLGGELRPAPLGNLAGCCLAAPAGEAKPTATLQVTA